MKFSKGIQLVKDLHFIVKIFHELVVSAPILLNATASGYLVA